MPSIIDVHVDRRILLTYMSFMSFICYGCFACCIGAALPDIADRLSTTETSLGILFTARGAGFLVGTSLFSSVSDFAAIVPSKEILVAVSVLIAGIGSNVISNSSDLSTVVVAIFFLSVLFSGIDILCNTLLPNLWGVKVQPWLHALHACWSIGGMVGPLLIGKIGYRQANIGLTVMCMIPSLILIYDLNSNKIRGNYGSLPKRAMDIEGAIPIDEKGKPEIHHSSDKHVVETKDVPLSNELRANFFVFYFLYVGLESGYGGWVSAYATNMNLTLSQAAYLASLFYFSMSMGRILSVPLSLRYQPSELMKMQLGITIMGAIFAMSSRGGGVGGNSTYTSLVVATATIGYGISSIFPIGLTLSHEHKLVM